MTPKTRITLEMYGGKFIYESDCDEFTADELKAMFSKMLVCVGYPTVVIDEK